MEFPFIVAISLIAGLFTQVLKFIFLVVRGQFRWSSLQEYGGMPSAHTAFVVSLTTVVGLHDGLNSTTFAIALIFSLLTIRDAIGLRQFLGQHGRALNMLIKDLPDEMEAKYPSAMVERVGHTPLQATVGAIIGLTVALVLYPLWFGF